ncbi:hypothetical protein AALB19_16000 [Oscillospiraceae bacterium 50-58]
MDEYARNIMGFNGVADLGTLAFQEGGQERGDCDTEIFHFVQIPFNVLGGGPT